MPPHDSQNIQQPNINHKITNYIDKCQKYGASDHMQHYRKFAMDINNRINFTTFRKNQIQTALYLNNGIAVHLCASSETIKHIKHHIIASTTKQQIYHTKSLQYNTTELSHMTDMSNLSSADMSEWSTFFDTQNNKNTNPYQIFFNMKQELNLKCCKIITMDSLPECQSDIPWSANFIEHIDIESRTNGRNFDTYKMSINIIKLYQDVPYDVGNVVTPKKHITKAFQLPWCIMSTSYVTKCPSSENPNSTSGGQYNSDNTTNKRDSNQPPYKENNDNDNNNNDNGFTGGNGNNGKDDGDDYDKHKTHDENNESDDDEEEEDDDDEDEKEDEKEDQKEEEKHSKSAHSESLVLNPLASIFRVKKSMLSTIHETTADIHGIKNTLISKINDPITPGKVKITQTMTNEIIPSRIKERIQLIFNYMNKLLVFSQIKVLYKNAQISICIINYDFHCKYTNESLYCIIIKHTNVSINSKYEWTMEDKLFTNNDIIDILNKFAIKSNSLPKPISMDKHFTHEINKFNNIKLNKLLISQTIDTIINNTKWHNISINSKKNNNERRILKLSTSEFKNKLTYYGDINTVNMNHLVAIVRINKKYEWWIEHLWIVKIEDNVTIGISLQLNAKTHKIDVTGIHLNKDFIIKSHTLIPPHNYNCNCLNGFISFYDDLTIGDIDEDKNTNRQLKRHLNQYKSNYYKLKQFIQHTANIPANTSVDSVKRAATQLLDSITSPVSDQQTVAVAVPQHTQIHSPASAFQFQSNQMPISTHTPILTCTPASQQPNDPSVNPLTITCTPTMASLSLPSTITCTPINNQTYLPNLLYTQMPYAVSYSPIQIPGLFNQMPFSSPTLSANKFAHVPFRLQNRKPIYIGKDITNKYLKEITQSFKFNNTKELFYYLHHSIMMQINDGFAQMFFNNPDLVVVNCDLYHTFGYDLYVIIQRYSSNINNIGVHKDKYDWQVVELCDIKTIFNKYHINNDQLSLSSRKSQIFMQKLNLHKYIKITHSDINRINFKSIKAIKSKSYKFLNKEKKIINCSLLEIRTWIITALDNNVMAIPIVRIKEHKHWIESVIICTIPRENINFGVSFVCNENNNLIEATCIFLDKMDIVNQNRLTGQIIICNALDRFVSGIGKMTIK